MHGGDIYRNKVHMDFSVNVNPLGISDGVMRALEQGIRKADVYPDPKCEELKKAIEKRVFKVVNVNLIPDCIVCGNGASELLLAICQWKKPTKAILPAPGFAGYRKVLQTVGCTWREFYLSEEQNFHWTKERCNTLCQALESEHYDILFMTNPANPTGTLMDREKLCEIAQVCERVGTLLVLDECFIELTDAPLENSLVGELKEFKQLLILRAFTKSFAIPGIRLGYLVCPDEKTARLIEEQLPEWNVSVPAQQAGIAAMKEENFLQQSRKLIANERDWLTKKLTQMGVKVFPSKANFILFQWTKDDLYQRLLEQGILIRDCSDYEGLNGGYYRIAVKKHEENEELIRIMHSVVKED